MRIAFVTTFLPSARASGADIASANLIDALRQAGHLVRVYGYISPTGAPPIEGEVALGPCTGEWSQASSLTRLRWTCSSFFSGRAVTSQKFHTQAYAAALHAAAAEAEAWILDHHHLDWLLPPIRLPSITVVHNIEHRIVSERASQNGLVARLLMQRDVRRLRRAEEYCLRVADMAWCYTDSDAEEVRALGRPARCVPLPGLSPSSAPPNKVRGHDLGILGLWTWEPNRRGLIWFLNHVLPLLPADISIAVGGRGTEGLPQDPRVRFPGFVPDANEFLRASRTIVIPSTVGGGIQIKSINAVSLGVTTVATRFAMRGLGSPPAWVVTEDTAEGMAGAIMSSLASPVCDPQAGLAWHKARCLELASMVDHDLRTITS